ncbi:MAG: hypothetical protein IJV05_00940 [Muribaculaceae bacterium]|nr:hypothetical protein [Muribaculaceae bacterium]
MKRNYKFWHLLALSLLFVTSLATLTSCGDDDDPKSTVIDYYLDVEEEFLVNGSSDLADRYISPIPRMRQAIHKAYPTPDTKGNDEAVIAACDKEYEEYLEMYVGGAEHFTCLFRLVRATKSGTVVKQNEILKTYTYDINPPEPVED